MWWFSNATTRHHRIRTRKLSSRNKLPLWSCWQGFFGDIHSTISGCWQCSLLLSRSWWEDPDIEDVTYWVIEHGETKLGSSWKFHLYRLALTKWGCDVHISGGENESQILYSSDYYKLQHVHGTIAAALLLKKPVTVWLNSCHMLYISWSPYLTLLSTTKNVCIIYCAGCLFFFSTWHKL